MIEHRPRCGAHRPRIMRQRNWGRTWMNLMPGLAITSAMVGLALTTGEHLLLWAALGLALGFMPWEFTRPWNFDLWVRCPACGLDDGPHFSPESAALSLRRHL